MIAITAVQVVPVGAIAVTIESSIAIIVALCNVVITMEGSSLSKTTDIGVPPCKCILRSIPISLIYWVDLFLGKHSVVAIVVVISDTVMVVEIPVDSVRKNAQYYIFCNVFIMMMYSSQMNYLKLIPIDVLLVDGVSGVMSSDSRSSRDMTMRSSMNSSIRKAMISGWALAELSMSSSTVATVQASVFQAIASVAA